MDLGDKIFSGGRVLDILKSLNKSEPTIVQTLPKEAEKNMETS